MSRKSFLIILISSLFLTLLTPFIFDAQFLAKPNESVVYHGAPFPFFQSPYTFPENPTQYPLTIDFILSNASFSFVPFLLSFVSIFLLAFSLFVIIARFFRKEPSR